MSPVEPDSRERSELLRELARCFRTVDPAELTVDELDEMARAIERAALHTGPKPKPPANVRTLPTRLGPDADLRRLRLTFQAVAAEADRAADEIDRRLNEAGR